jgi:hypothetical protein
MLCQTEATLREHVSAVTSNIGLPDVMDGGNPIRNLQIHKLTGNHQSASFPVCVP